MKFIKIQKAKKKDCFLNYLKGKDKVMKGFIVKSIAGDFHVYDNETIKTYYLFVVMKLFLILMKLITFH